MAPRQNNIIDLSQQLLQNQWSARLDSSVDDNADDAAAASNLADETGGDAGTIYDNLEPAQRQYKQHLSNSIVASDPYLQRYINSHPLAAKISNDDWGNMAQAGESHRQAAALATRPWWDIAGNTVIRSMAGGAGQLVSAGGRMFDSPALSRIGKQIMDNIDIDVPMSEQDQNRISAQIGSGIGQMIDLIPGLVLGGPGAAAVQMGVQTGEAEAEKAEKAGHPEQAANVFTGGFVVGTALGMLPLGQLQRAGAGVLEKGVINRASTALKEAVATGLTFGATGELQQAATSLLERETFDPQAKYSPDITRMGANVILGAVLGGSFGLVKPFVDNNEPIPPGVHTVSDRILIEKSKVDNEALDNAVKDAAATATKERSPAFMAKYFRLQPNATVSLDGAKVLELYGNKPPSPDDGILGWLPGIGDKLQAAARDGGDIQVPLADYLARIEPDVDKELHDFRRLGDGLSLDDAKNLAAGTAPGEQEEEPKTIGGLKRSPVPVIDAVRAQTGLDKILPQPELYDSHLAGDTPGPGILPKDYNPQNKIERATDSGVKYTATATYKGRDLLNNLDVSLFKDRASKALYQFFGKKIGDIVGDLPVNILSDAETNRLYTSLGGWGGSNAFHLWDRGFREPLVVLNESTASGINGRMYANHAVIHELAHAASVRYMRENPELGDQVRDLRDETLKWVQQNKPDLLDHVGISYALGVKGNLGGAFDKPGNEFVAQAYSEPDFQDLLAEVPISKDLANRIGHPAATNMWEAARHLVKRAFEALLGKKMPTSALDAMFTMGAKFEAAHLKDPSLVTAEPFKEEETIPSPEERQLFRDQKTLGYTKSHWERIKAKIAQQKQADNEFQAKQIEAQERERLSEERKQLAAEMKPEADEHVLKRSDVAADRFLRSGIAPDGSKVERQRLDPQFIKPDILKLMDPEHYGATQRGFRKVGLNPDDIAGMFGYLSGDDMVHDLAGMHQERVSAGLTPSAHIKNLQDIELERMMKAKYGTLEEQVLEATKDHILNDGQYDLLHEDTLRLATKYGIQGEPWTKNDIKAMARGDLDDGMRVGELKSTRLADQTGKIGRKIEDAENKGDGKTVMQLAQQREISFYKTIEARKFEKLQSQAEKVMKQHRKIDQPRFKREDAMAYHDTIVSMMGQLGESIGKRRLDDVNKELGEKGYTSYADFLQKKIADGHDIPASDWVLDGMKNDKGVPYKELDNLTVGEGRSFYTLIKSLDKQGKESFTYEVAGEKRDLEPYKNAILDELERFDPKREPLDPGWFDRTVGKTFKYYIASSVNEERLFNRIDGNNPRGPMNQLVVRTFTGAANNKEVLARKYGGMLRELGEPPTDLGKSVRLPFKDPSTGLDFPRATNKSKLAIMLNMGSVENWTKFTNGWKVDPAVLETWVMQNSTKEEWAWVKGIWKIFDAMKVDLDREYRRTTGDPPGSKEFRTINTPAGPIEGGYYPLNHDEQSIGKGSRMATVTTEDGKSFFQAAIPNPHAKAVTGAEYPVSMNLDLLPNRVQQIVHDIAFRNPLHEMQKVLKDKQIRQAIRDRMGLEYDQGIDTWLKDISHAGTGNDAAGMAGNNINDFFRQNVISYLVGLNISTVAKHFPTALENSARLVGHANLMKAYGTLFNSSSTVGDNWWKFAMNNSEELQRRERFWQDTFGGAYKDFTKSTIREHIIQWGAKPVAFSDKISAVPMWIAAYKKAIDEGMEKGEAVFEADRMVRFAHGSTAITNLPRIARGGGIHSWMTSLYGFFGTMMQNRMEMAWKVNDMYRLGKQGELGKSARILPVLAADTFAYIVWPTVVEEYVTGLWSDDRRGWGQRVAWATAGGLASSFIYARDLVHGLEYGLDTSGGMLGSAVKPFVDGVNDVEKIWSGKSKAEAGKYIADLIALTAYTHGVPKEMGNLAEYGWDTLIAKKEHPYTGVMKNWHQFGDLGLGLTRGTQKYTVRR